MADITPTVITANNGYYLDGVSADFEAGGQKMKDELGKAQENLATDPSDPTKLAFFQSKLQQYTLFRSAQTSTVKVIKDIGSAIIQNFR
ncbi:type III secretion system needle filament subunit SctF [Erwinia sp.]|uniref:type III secretion system needle filament subunit SctF n=1 Tax=Erwinia citreus TaxID=558 RepID=UPI00289D9248|nr:type III secretion system needle filament subunit SctF [Erwinia sp.]